MTPPTPEERGRLRALAEHKDVRSLDDEMWGEGTGHADCFQPCCATEAEGRLARGAARALPALLDALDAAERRATEARRLALEEAAAHLEESAVEIAEAGAHRDTVDTLRASARDVRRLAAKGGDQ